MIRTYYSLHCDGSQPDGLDCFGVIRDLPTRRALLRVARAEGWARVRVGQRVGRGGFRMKDYCPACLAAAQEGRDENQLA